VWDLTTLYYILFYIIFVIYKSFLKVIFFTHLSFASMVSTGNKILFIHLSFLNMVSTGDKILFMHFFYEFGDMILLCIYKL